MEIEYISFCAMSPVLFNIIQYRPIHLPVFYKGYIPYNPTYKKLTDIESLIPNMYVVSSYSICSSNKVTRKYLIPLIKFEMLKIGHDKKKTLFNCSRNVVVCATLSHCQC